MSDSRYRALVTAASLGSITAAADALGYTQSGVSHLIDALEDEMGFKLLIRARSGCSLTPEGEAMMPYLNSLIGASDTVTEMAENIKGVRSGQIRIGTFSSVALQWLPGLLNAYLKRFPGIDVKIINGTYSTLENQLFQRVIDCAFVTATAGGTGKIEKGGFTILPLAEDPLMVVVCSGHPFSKLPSVTPDMLSGERFIMPAEGSGYDISTVFSMMDAPADIRFEMNDDFAAIGMARAGLGITVLPQLLIKDYPMEGLAAVPISGITRHIGLAYRTDYISPAVKAFIQITGELLK